jgi:DNA-3-methyladenine glycosylase I
MEYKKIFEQVEEKVRSLSKIPQRFDYYRNFETRTLNDSDYFDILVIIIFYSGFRSETVTKKLPAIRKHFLSYEIVANYNQDNIEHIMGDVDMIKNESKIRACIYNAGVLKRLIAGYGSFSKYIESFNAKESLENLILLKEDVKRRFKYLGEITSYHLLTDIGLPVLKPDRVITRIFKRLGLIEDTNQLLETIMQGRKFSEATGYPIRYIDIIFVKYGQVGVDEEFGSSSGICLEKNPRCDICSIKDWCKYENLV